MNCGACRHSLCPRHRRGLFVCHILSLMGFYPWECLNCGMSYYFHQRKTVRLDRQPSDGRTGFGAFGIQ
jgi:hypothetical protein